MLGYTLATGQNSPWHLCCLDTADLMRGRRRGHFYILHTVGGSQPLVLGKLLALSPCSVMKILSAKCQYLPYGCAIQCIHHFSKLWDNVRQVCQPVSYINDEEILCIIPLLIVCIVSDIIKSTGCSNVQLCEVNAKENQTHQFIQVHV